MFPWFTEISLSVEGSFSGPLKEQSLTEKITVGRERWKTEFGIACETSYRENNVLLTFQEGYENISYDNLYMIESAGAEQMFDNCF